MRRLDPNGLAPADLFERLDAMPNSPRKENRHRMVRVEDDLWESAKATAAANGTTVSAVIRDCLQRYVKRYE